MIAVFASNASISLKSFFSKPFTVIHFQFLPAFELLPTTPLLPLTQTTLLFTTDMDEVKVVGRPVDRRIHVHRRDHDAVLNAHFAEPERREHRRGGLVRFASRRALPEPALDSLKPFAVAQAEVFVADALAAREQRVSELERLEMRVALQSLEPFGRVARAVLELEDFEVPLRLIFVERGFEAEVLAIEHIRKFDRVLEGELGAAADREMRGVRGVA